MVSTYTMEHNVILLLRHGTWPQPGISHDLSDSASLLAVRAALAFSIWRHPGNSTSRRYQELRQGELSSL